MSPPAITDHDQNFLSKVDVGAVDECWPWIAGKQSMGYGYFWISGTPELAHRRAYERWIGPIPKGKEVLHTCDNPPCCNPAHLFIGTHADNMRDMAEKGRSGQKGNFKIPAEAREEICRHHAVGEISIRALGREHGVSHETIRKILGR